MSAARPSQVCSTVRVATCECLSTVARTQNNCSDSGSQLRELSGVAELFPTQIRFRLLSRMFDECIPYWLAPWLAFRFELDQMHRLPRGVKFVPEKAGLESPIRALLQ